MELPRWIFFGYYENKNHFKENLSLIFGEKKWTQFFGKKLKLSEMCISKNVVLIVLSSANNIEKAQSKLASTLK